MGNIHNIILASLFLNHTKSIICVTSVFPLLSVSAFNIRIIAKALFLLLLPASSIKAVVQIKSLLEDFR